MSNLFSLYKRKVFYKIFFSPIYNLVLKQKYIYLRKGFVNFLLLITGSKVKFLNIKDNLICDSNKNIYISRKNRLNYFYHGIECRLKKLFNEYVLEDISFKEEDLIIDCGANIGELSSYFHSKFAIKKIIAIEPSIREFNVLCKNLPSQYIKLNIALYNIDGELTFFEKNKSADSSLIEMKDYEKKVVVKCMTLSSLFSKYNINKCKLLKLEAEGAEPEILLGAKNILNKVEYISVDVGPERGLEELTTTTEVTDMLYENNFKLIDFGKSRSVLLFKNNL